jgi:hypothetical protein
MLKLLFLEQVRPSVHDERPANTFGIKFLGNMALQVQAAKLEEAIRSGNINVHQQVLVRTVPSRVPTQDQKTPPARPASSAVLEESSPKQCSAEHVSVKRFPAK